MLVPSLSELVICASCRELHCQDDHRYCAIGKCRHTWGHGYCDQSTRWAKYRYLERCEWTVILKFRQYGEYSLQAQMAAFAVAKTVVQVTGTDRATQADLNLILLSRSERLHGNARQVTRGRGFQSLSVASTEAEADATARGNDTIVPSGISIPGMTENSATESIAVSGNASAADSSFSSNKLSRPHARVP